MEHGILVQQSVAWCYIYTCNLFNYNFAYFFPQSIYIFLYFWLFLFSSSYYKFPILFHLLCIVFSHKNVISLSFSNFFLFNFWWSWFPIMWLLWICCAREIMVHSQSFVIMVQWITSFFCVFIINIFAAHLHQATSWNSCLWFQPI